MDEKRDDGITLNTYWHKPLPPKNAISLRVDVMRDWIGGWCSDASLLGYDDSDFYESPPERGEVLERALVCAKILENLSRSISDPERASYAAMILKDTRWQSILDMLKTTQGYEEFIRRIRERKRKENIAKFRARICEDISDSILQEDEYTSAIRYAQTLNIPKSQAEAIIQEVLDEKQATIQGSIIQESTQSIDINMPFPNGQMEGFETKVGSLAELPDAFFKEWYRIRDMFERGEFSSLLERSGAQAGAIIAAKETEQQITKVKEELKDTIIMGFLWRIGYRCLAVMDEIGQPVLVSSLDELKSVCDGRPQSLTAAIQSGRLAHWLRYVVQDMGLANIAEEARLRGVTPSLLLEAAERFLWHIGCKKLRVGGRFISSLDELSKITLSKDFLADLERVVSSGIFMVWARDVQKANDRIISNIFRAGKAKEGYRSLGVMWALGSKTLIIGDTVINDICDFINLQPDALGDVIRIIRNGTLSLYLEIVWDIDPEVTHNIERLLGFSERRAYQEVLWCLGHDGLRLKNGRSWYDVRKREDLVIAWTQGLSEEVIKAFEDGRLKEWACRKEFTDIVEVIRSQGRDPWFKLIHCLWLCGYKALPLRPWDISGPQTLESLYRYIRNGDHIEDVLYIHRVGLLSLWLRYALKLDDLANKIEAIANDIDQINEVLKSQYPRLGMRTQEGSEKKQRHGFLFRGFAYLSAFLLVGIASILWMVGYDGWITIGLASTGILGFLCLRFMI